MTTKKKVSKKVTTEKQEGDAMSDKKDKALKTKEEMQSSGEKTGKIAARTFLANGKYCDG